MGIVRTGNSAWEKEEARWNTPRNQEVIDGDGQPTGIMGMAPVGFEPFPAMLYKAQKKENGKVLVIAGEPSPNQFLNAAEYERAVLATTSFNTQNQRIVKNQAEKDRAVSEGWRDSPQEALEFFERLEEEMGRAAAETNFAVQRMSSQARAEHQAATDATHEHLADVPIPPKRKRGRPARVKSDA
jgi:hypothetical protein